MQIKSRKIVFITASISLLKIPIILDFSSNTTRSMEKSQERSLEREREVGKSNSVELRLNSVKRRATKDVHK